MLNLLKELNIYVDLAVEAQDLVRGAANVEIPGVIEKVEKLEHIKVNYIAIENEIGAQRMQRPVGTYITLECPPLKINDPYVKDEIIETMGKYIPQLIANKITLNSLDTVLLVGLGNWRATADSLGPKFIQYSPITRHYYQYAPQALVEGMRPCCGIAPGVLGITGLETYEVIKGIVDSVKPALLIVVDSLAAQNVERIGTTIQMANTGIQPGSGIGNARRALDQSSLGVPVIAIGCPTIVNSAVITHQAIEKYCQKTNTVFNEIQASQSIKDCLSFFGGNLAVTPKDIDDIIENTSRIIAMGTATALFPGISLEQLELYAT